MSNRIKLLVPKMPTADALLPYLRRVDETRWYSNFGQLERELVERLENRFGAYVVTVSSCTAGLELMYRHVKQDLQRVSIDLPALTFPATVLAAKREGLWVNFEDVDSATWTHRNVAGFGVPVDGRWVDAAAAFGEQKVGGLQTVVFSLHATKLIGAGEGGFIVTHDKRLAQKFYRQTNFGFDQAAGTGISRGWGTNAKLSEYHAAVALASLDTWTCNLVDWVSLDCWYRKHLPTSVQQQMRPVGAYPILGVALPHPGILDSVRRLMASQGIETRRWYWPPMHLHPCVAGQRSPPSLPVTEHLGERLLGLPYHLFLTEADVQRVCSELATAVEMEMNHFSYSYTFNAASPVGVIKI